MCLLRFICYFRVTITTLTTTITIVKISKEIIRHVQPYNSVVMICQLLFFYVDFTTGKLTGEFAIHTYIYRDSYQDTALLDYWMCLRSPYFDLTDS